MRRAVLCAIVGLGFATVPSVVPAQTTGRALAIEDYYRILDVSAPQMSPDGKWVAYTVSRRIEATNGDSSEVFLVATTGAPAPLRVSTAGSHATNPQWMADGRLRFASGGRWWVRGPAGELTDGGPSAAGAGRGGRGGGGESRLTSAGGRSVAILRDTPPPPVAPEPRTAFEQRHEERFKGHQFDWLNFQADGQPFPVPNASDPRVRPPQEIVLTTGTGERQLTRLGLRPAGVNWNASGTHLAFAADSQYRDERVYGADQVFTVSTDGAVRRLTSDADHEHTGALFSPDGQWILSTHQLSTDAVIARRLDHGGATDLVLIPAAGGAERVLTAEWDLLPSAPRWSPDGRFVYFTGGIGGAVHLFRVPVAGGAVEQVIAGSAVCHSTRR